MHMSKVTCSVVSGVFAGVLVAAVPAAAQAPTSAPARPAVQEPRETTRDKADSDQPVKDSWITMKIHSQFVPEDALEDSDINVDTMNGVVTLNGTVASAAGRDRAVAIAKATDGVKNVNDRLRVSVVRTPDTNSPVGTAGRETKEAGKSMTKAVSDGWITSKIYSQFITEDALDDSDIDIDVERGVVTLKGTVASAAGQSRAEQIAKATDGVKSVNNNLKVGAHR
jgi:hyperosmotically inducible protein